MVEQLTSVRRSDPGLKWLVAGGVLTTGMLCMLVAFLADTVGRDGPSGAAAVGVLGLLVAGAAAAIALGPIGRALATRILGGGAGTDPALDSEVDALRFQVEDLRQALAETHERLDFTERLLAGSSEKRS